MKRVPEVSYFDAADLLGEVFVDTIDTVSPYHIMTIINSLTSLTVSCFHHKDIMKNKVFFAVYKITFKLEKTWK